MINIVKLEEICHIQAGGTPSRSKKEYWNGDIKWLKIRDIKSKYVSETTERITDLGLEKSSTKLFPRGTIIYTIFATLGEVAILKDSMTTNQAIAGIQILNQNDADTEYLYYYLISIKSDIIDKGRGVAQNNINLTILRNIEIPLPTLTKQKEIASILDKAQELIALRKESIKKLDELSKSIFIDMFGDPVSNPKNFERGRIRDLIIEAKYGSSQKSNENDGEFVMLRMNNITYSGSLNLESLKYVDLSEIDKSKYLVKKGDLLFNRTNSKELVGKTLVYNLDEPMAFAGYLIRIRTEHISTTQFISAFLNSKYGKQLLQSMAKAIVGMANINAQELQNIKILMPPLELQNKFANIIEKIEEQKSLYEEELEKLEENFKALLQKSFN